MSHRPNICLSGYVYVNETTLQTSINDIFAGGDVITGPKFAIDAISAEKKAAISIHRFVHEGQTLTYGRDHRDYKPLDKSTVLVPVESFDTAVRQIPLCKDGDAANSFIDLRGSFTESQLMKEAY